MSSHCILIVDNDELSRKFLDIKFQETGYTFFAEGNAKEGLIAAFQPCPHIIIVDPATIDISLDEFVRKIRKDRRTNKYKLIALASTASHEDEEEIIALSFACYLTKSREVLPTLTSYVKEAIDDLVDKRQTREKTSYREKNNEFEEKSGKIVVLKSAKGGTGTSSICANLAHLVNENEKYQVASVWNFLLENGINKAQVYLLINRAVGLEGFSKSEVVEKIGMVIPNAIPHMGRNYTLANSQHLPILHRFPDDTVTIAMRQAVRDIQERPENRYRSLDLLQNFIKNI